MNKNKVDQFFEEMNSDFILFLEKNKKKLLNLIKENQNQSITSIESQKFESAYNPEEQLTIFSAFHGCGGTTHLFDKKRFEVIALSDIKPSACDHARYRFPSIKNYGNIVEIDSEKLPNFDMMTFGFPCKSFSKQGKQLGFKDKKNGDLFFVSCRIIDHKKPKFILAENVENLLNHDQNQTITTVLENLSELGYYVDFKLTGGVEHGIPQIRKRVFIFGVRKDCINELKPHIGTIINDFTERRRIEKEIDQESQDQSGTNVKHREYKLYKEYSRSIDSFRRHELISKSKCRVHPNELESSGRTENYKSLENINNGTEKNTVNLIPYSNTTKGLIKTYRIRLDDIANTLIENSSGCNASNGGNLVLDHGNVRYLSPNEGEFLMSYEKDWTKYGCKENGTVFEFSPAQRYSMLGDGIISICSRDIIESIL